MLIPLEMTAETVYEKEKLFDIVGIADWMLPAAYAGHFKNLVWLKPPWAKQIEEGQQLFHVGATRSDNTIRVDCKENYFVSECLFCPTEELINSKEVSLEVITLGKRLEGGSDDFNGVRNILEKYVDKCTPYILDIDLDFFSTNNPFESVFSKASMYSKLKHIYKYDPPKSKSLEDILVSTKKREKQISHLHSIFQTLQDAKLLPECPSDSSILHDAVGNLRSDILKHYKEEEIDWLLVHDAGCTCDDTDLPNHVSTKEEIDEMLECFENFLEVLVQAPVIITISRSTEDDYTPGEDVDYIQTKVLELLHRKFVCDAPVLDYLETNSVDE